MRLQPLVGSRIGISHRQSPGRCRALRARSLAWIVEPTGNSSTEFVHCTIIGAG
ncbi:hypothetical protein TVNIR_1243 [Thioalkalivibrio nitratireducens DSM 14787]|uniref:Uncharacterized protein n=1 Tax=Thioalkalivibrio nitratireducens (strain DSM 14787 / UNIQEM 213 / ALEN2) TaxID=1255043 RepID=L0DV90_THIND|nr:hypothetical protein TVNIR_1243 [Thioalkalivibrio nitratireducens DSM 14787]